MVFECYSAGEMLIEKVHGLQATSISLSDRFTMLTAAHRGRISRMRRRSVNSLNNANPAFVNRNLIRQLRMEQQARRQQIKQRLGLPPLRRFGSEGNLPGLRSANSFGSLNKLGRNTGAAINSNLSRSASFTSLSQMTWRSHGGFKRRGGSVGPVRGRLRGRGRGRGTGIGRQVRQVGALRGRRPTRGLPQRGRGAVGGRGAARGRGAASGRGRGGVTRNQAPKKPVTKEELDAQLDQYMASTKSALDKEIDEYMRNSIMDLE